MGYTSIPVYGQAAVESVRRRGFLDQTKEQMGGLESWQYQAIRLATEISEFCRDMCPAEWADMYINSAALAETLGVYPVRMFGDKPFGNTSVPYPSGEYGHRFTLQHWRDDFSAMQHRILKGVYGRGGALGMGGILIDFVDLLLAFASDITMLFRYLEYVPFKLKKDEKRGQLHDGQVTESGVEQVENRIVPKEYLRQIFGVGVTVMAGVTVIGGEHGVFLFPTDLTQVLSAVPRKGIDGAQGYYIRAYPDKSMGE